MEKKYFYNSIYPIVFVFTLYLQNLKKNKDDNNNKSEAQQNKYSVNVLTIPRRNEILLHIGQNFCLKMVNYKMLYM